MKVSKESEEYYSEPLSDEEYEKREKKLNRLLKINEKE